MYSERSLCVRMLNIELKYRILPCNIIGKIKNMLDLVDFMYVRRLSQILAPFNRFVDCYINIYLFIDSYNDLLIFLIVMLLLFIVYSNQCLCKYHGITK